MFGLLRAMDTGVCLLKSQRPLYDRESENMTGCYSTVIFRGQEFVASAYVRDVNCRGFSAYGLAEDLSHLAALNDAARSIVLMPSDDL